MYAEMAAQISIPIRWAVVSEMYNGAQGSDTKPEETPWI